MGSAAAAGGKGTSAPALNETLPRQMLGFHKENLHMDQKLPTLKCNIQKVQNGSCYSTKWKPVLF